MVAMKFAAPLRTVLALLLAIAAAPTLLPPAASAAATAPVHWKNFKQPAAIEPTRINVNYSTGFAWATGLDQWQDWGKKHSFVDGTLHLNTCRPFCAAGNYKAYVGRVTLFKIRMCGNQRRYLDIKIKRTNQPPVSWGSNCLGEQIKAP